MQKQLFPDKIKLLTPQQVAALGPAKAAQPSPTSASNGAASPTLKKVPRWLRSSRCSSASRCRSDAWKAHRRIGSFCRRCPRRPPRKGRSSSSGRGLKDFFILSDRGDRLAVLLGALPAGDHAGERAGVVPAASWTRYVRSAALDVIRLQIRNHRALQGTKGTCRHHRARGAQRADSRRHPGSAAAPLDIRRCDRHPAVSRVPGIGSLLISAILANDTPVIMAITFVLSCLVIGFNLLADILYGWLDPRISLRFVRGASAPGADRLARAGHSGGASSAINWRSSVR